MKHKAHITLVLILVFFVSQVVGLGVIYQYVDQKTVNDDGTVNVEYKELPLNIERPEINPSHSYIYITGAVVVGTILALLLIRMRSIRVWKTWFFLSVLLCLTVSFKPLLSKFSDSLLPLLTSTIVFGFNASEILAFLLALGFAYIKIFQQNVYLNNLTEIFIYGGLSAIFVPVIDLRSAFILLAIISAYDMYAVWRSRHMITLATFQRDSKVFAGLSIPYTEKTTEERVVTAAPKKAAKKTKSKKKVPTPKQEVVVENVETTRTAMLGGGDIGFPMFFAGVVMKTTPFLITLMIPLCAGIALFMLLTFGKQDRFYPAMPFISIGCVVGYLLTLIM